MYFSTQYYRAPFPERHRWRDDLQSIRSTGLQAIQFWAAWAWIEPEPDRFLFDDFDELVELAAKQDLGVIFTAVAELQPYWIHEEIPDSFLIDHTGTKVRSSTLAYNPHGLSPGGCPDNPRVQQRMRKFLETLARRYAQAKNMILWDCWNEIRLTINADGYVCHCPHTLRAYSQWLQNRYGNIHALNETWHTRFSTFESIPPGLPGRCWVETMAWQQFLEHRTAEILSFRISGVRAGDPNHPIIAHSLVVSPIQGTLENPFDPAGSRGNMWELSSRADGHGVSLFPAFFRSLPSEDGIRLQSMVNATGDSLAWVSEMQGGTSRTGFGVDQAVPAARQQRWIWTAVGRGIKFVNFWCWRDEVFGREAGGFGIIGDDGHADERVAALRSTMAFIRNNEGMLDSYRPAPAAIGVVFDTLNHQLEWVQNGRETAQSPGSIRGYLNCLECLQTPYDVLDAAHLARLSTYRLLILPWPMIVRDSLAQALKDWIQAGGTLIAESEMASYNEHSFYTYPAERHLPNALGIRGAGRRQIVPDEQLPFSINGLKGVIRPFSWLEPVIAKDGDVISSASAGDLIVSRRVGKGKIIFIGTHAGLAYSKERYADFESFVAEIIRSSNAAPAIRCSVTDGEAVQFRFGFSGKVLLLICTNAGALTQARFRWTDPTLTDEGQVATDLIAGRTAPVARKNGMFQIEMVLDEGGSHVITIPHQPA